MGFLIVLVEAPAGNTRVPNLLDRNTSDYYRYHDPYVTNGHDGKDNVSRYPYPVARRKYGQVEEQDRPLCEGEA